MREHSSVAKSLSSFEPDHMTSETSWRCMDVKFLCLSTQNSKRKKKSGVDGVSAAELAALCHAST